ncbi:hypothetical protein HYPSUDRAFT_108833, partial [Hypholoma sublateritium FD-334 SS-4]
KIEFRWIPGHENIAASDRVDKEAKLAATGYQANKGEAKGILRKELPASKAATRQEIIRRLKKKLIKDFHTTSHRYAKIAIIDPSTPSQKYRTICKSLTR